jgi:dTMP kinase
MRGTFITFEGPEGSGKSTQARRVAERLKQMGREVVYTREPGGTLTGEFIRDILQHNKAGEPLSPQAEVFLFAASRAQLVQNVIKPALKRGGVVISDRFADSTTAYQGYGRGFPLEDMLAINDLAIDGAIPDLTLLLDVTVDLGFSRLALRSAARMHDFDRFEREERVFHERVRQGYLELARRWPERIKVLDGSKEAPAVEADVWEAVSRVLDR